MKQTDMRAQPTKSVLDRSFRYTPSFETNLKATFARIRREQRQARALAQQAVAEAEKKVLPIKQSKTRPAQ
jgi:4'-phosphopantetheinyl transferase EntD